jgi:glucosamine--fructose-6-phosphate aminotransferase (isomerizing)
MCGVVGYIGARKAQPVLLNCLARLEYRGYDSCGIALDGGSLRVCKDIGKIAELAKAAPQLDGRAGIGHTRWATHGAPSRVNAHPHLDCSGAIAVVHNGIIDNFQALRHRLEAEGHRFLSDTDTEVIPHLIEKYYRDSLEEAVVAALAEIKGSYAVIVLAAGESKLVVARNGSPLIIGVGDREHFIASDVPAVLDYTNRVIYLEDGDMAVVTSGGVSVTSQGARVERKESRISWGVEDAQKAGYEHFMLKEIHEQPKVIRDTLVNWVSVADSVVDIATMRRNLESMLILACGTSYHAALIGKYVIEELLGIPVRVEIASGPNRRHRHHPVR